MLRGCKKKGNKKKVLIALIVIGLLLSGFTLIAGAYYVGSSESDVFHKSSCHYVDRIKQDHKVYFDTYDAAINAGYRPCKVCKPTPPLTPRPYSPEVTTKAATGIGTTYATLNGNLDSTGRLSCQIWFEHGTTMSYGRSTTKKSTSSSGAFSEPISDLTPGTTYHFRAIASNRKGIDYGSDKSFRTLCYPIASFTYSPKTPVINETVSFDASLSYDPDGSLTKYKWDFGDGYRVTGEMMVIAKHSYSLPGNYSVTLTVTDNDLLTDTETCTTHIKSPPVPAGEWIKRANTPEAGGYGEAVVSADDYIYIARCMYATSTPYFWRYDPSTNIWNESMNVSGLPTGAFRTGTALTWDHGDSIYALLGGRYNDSNRTLFYRYCISNNTWTRLTDTPHTQCAGDAITWANGYIYVMMGSRSHKTVFARYNCSNSSWAVLSLPNNWKNETDDGASLVWTGGTYLYALQGEVGEDGNQPITNFSRYNISTDSSGTWEDMHPIPEIEGVGDGASLLWIGNWVAEYANCIFALGGGSGLTGEAPGNKSYTYCILDDEWENLPSIPCPVGEYVGNRLGFANDNIYYWQGTPKTWDCGGKAFFMFDLVTQGRTQGRTPIIVEEKKLRDCLMRKWPYEILNPSPTTHIDIVINEVEPNPPEDDRRKTTMEWVEIYNPTSNDINLGSWTVSSTQYRGGKTFTLYGTIKANGYYVFEHSLWLHNTKGESVILRDADGTEIDRTPMKNDDDNDHYSWQRYPNGKDTWKFRSSTKGSSNGG